MNFKKRQLVALILMGLVIVAGYIQYTYRKSSETGSGFAAGGRLGEAVYVDSIGSERLTDSKSDNNLSNNNGKSEADNSAAGSNGKSEADNSATGSNGKSEDNSAAGSNGKSEADNSAASNNSKLGVDNSAVVNNGKSKSGLENSADSSSAISKVNNSTDNKDSKDVPHNQPQNGGTTSLKATDRLSAALEYFADARMEKENQISSDTEILRSISEDRTADQDTKKKAYGKLIKIVENVQRETRLEQLIREKGYKDVLCYISEDGSIDVLVLAQELTSATTAQIADIVNRQAGISYENMHIKNVY